MANAASATVVLRLAITKTSNTMMAHNDHNHRDIKNHDVTNTLLKTPVSYIVTNLFVEYCSYAVSMGRGYDSEVLL